MQFYSYTQNKEKIINNLNKISMSSCSMHKNIKAEQFCTHSSCIKNFTPFLCELCVIAHNLSHKAQNLIPVYTLFSTQLLEKVLHDKKPDSSTESIIMNIMNQVHVMLSQLAKSLAILVDDCCTKVHNDIRKRLLSLIKDEDQNKVIYDYQEILFKLFYSEASNFQEYADIFVKQYHKLFEIRKAQIQFEYDELYFKSEDIIKKLKRNHNDIFSELNDIIKDKIDKFEIDSYKKLFKNDIIMEKIPNIAIDNSNLIPRLHTKPIKKVLFCEDTQKLITCSSDNTIIIRSIEDSQDFKVLQGHTNWITDMIFLNDKRLASSSLDSTIKIWNLQNGICVQTLIGSVYEVFSLIELSDSILLSCSLRENNLRIWDLNEQDKSVLYPFHVIENKRLKPCCMILINKNEIAISSTKNIYVYKFDDLTKTQFKIVNIIRNEETVGQIKLMKNGQDQILNISNEKCKLWKLPQGYCLRTFWTKQFAIKSLVVLTDKIFAVGGDSQIKFWHIDKEECIQVDMKNRCVDSMTQISEERIVCYGGLNNDLLFIKI